MHMITTVLNILLIVLGFGLLIFVHELGHFLAAKWAGIRTEAFAIGMGPVVVSWRKGVGLALGSTDRRVAARAGRPAAELSDQELARHGLGETEYSLRWLPIGGFVKMLGQEDANPSAVSDDPRSYTRCPVGKRMIVVSAGVIMNLILAAVLFVYAFMVGVPLEAAVVGEVSRSLPAGTTAAVNAEGLGVDRAGLMPGDRVTHIDGDEARTFADLQIASAMARPGESIVLRVEREGVSEPLEFQLVPRKDGGSGLLSIGITPASSNRLVSRDQDDVVAEALERSGLAAHGVELGMVVRSAGGRDVETYQALSQVVEASGGRPVTTVWSAVDDDGVPVGPRIEAPLSVLPVYQVLLKTGAVSDTAPNYEQGLLGLSPLVRITSVEDDLNREVLRGGDLVLRAGDLEGPRRGDFVAELARHKRGEIDLLVLRGDEEVPVKARVDRHGKLRVMIESAWDAPIVAEPMTAVRPSLDPGDRTRSRPTPIAGLDLPARSRVVSVSGTPVPGWPEFREALRAHTREALESEQGATISLVTADPAGDHPELTSEIELSAETVAELHALTWSSELPSYAFDPIRALRTAEGNPLTAVTMGLEETYKLIIMTYLTIDRLIRGSVGVDQLRGPVGIVHLGTKIIDRGFVYLVFLLGMISVNLAVINFLPLPIVDGGLFLFLVYEKIKGRPPSLAFQNAATVVGLILIGTMLLVVTWNDVMRLIS